MIICWGPLEPSPSLQCADKTAVSVAAVSLWASVVFRCKLQLCHCAMMLSLSLLCKRLIQAQKRSMKAIDWQSTQSYYFTIKCALHITENTNPQKKKKCLSCGQKPTSCPVTVGNKQQYSNFVKKKKSPSLGYYTCLNQGSTIACRNPCRCDYFVCNWVLGYLLSFDLKKLCIPPPPSLRMNARSFLKNRLY